MSSYVISPMSMNLLYSIITSSVKVVMFHAITEMRRRESEE
jgi:hypothetical protein